jgi:hypothetical protein
LRDFLKKLKETQGNRRIATEKVSIRGTSNSGGQTGGTGKPTDERTSKEVTENTNKWLMTDDDS